MILVLFSSSYSVTLVCIVTASFSFGFAVTAYLRSPAWQAGVALMLAFDIKVLSGESLFIILGLAIDFLLIPAFSASDWDWVGEPPSLLGP